MRSIKCSKAIILLINLNDHFYAVRRIGIYYEYVTVDDLAFHRFTVASAGS